MRPSFGRLLAFSVAENIGIFAVTNRPYAPDLGEACTALLQAVR